MSEVLQLLPSDRFIRVHKSYIVAPEHIDVFEKHRLKIDGKSISIGQTYREGFMKFIKEQVNQQCIFAFVTPASCP